MNDQLLSTALAIPSDDPLERISVLDAYQYVTGGLNATTHKRGGYYIVRCPVQDHEDVHPSCSLNPRNDMWKCFSCGHKGGKLQMVIEAGKAKNRGEAAEWLKRAAGTLRLRLIDQPAMKAIHVRGEIEHLENEHLSSVHPFNDEKGRLLYQVMRYDGDAPEGGGRAKRFVQRAPKAEGGWKYELKGIRRVPYLFEKLLAARTVNSNPETPSNKKRSIIVIEGEQKADFLTMLGFVATTNNEGSAWDWPPSWAQYFDGAEIIFIIGDADKAGRKAMEKRAKLLDKPKRTIVQVDLYPDKFEGEDLINWAVEQKIIRNPKNVRGLIKWDALLLVSKEEARKKIQAKLIGYYKAQKAS